MALATGARLGSYEVIAPLGSGGMGEVYRARDTRLGRIVAIKIIPARIADVPTRRQRFEREARAVSTLNHPHICTLYDVGQEDPRPDGTAAISYLVMEYLDGETLAQRLLRGPLPLHEVLSYAIQMADALDHAHRAGIIHRDLKPANVTLTHAGVKLLDFGLAKFHATEPAPAETLLAHLATVTDSLTEEGTIVGTIPYVAPEQLEGRACDARADIFALGAVMYEMAAGRPAFDGMSKAAIMAAVIERTPPSPSSVRARTRGDESTRIPASLELIISRCLEKHPEARFASAGEVSRALAACLPRSTPRVAAPRAVIIGAGLAVVIGGVSLVGWTYARASHARWAEREAVPQITRLVEENRRLAADRLFRQAESYAPASRRLLALSEGLTTSPVSIHTTPPGAQISISDYADPGGDSATWEPLGTTPFEARGIPFWGYYRVRAVKAGFMPVELAYSPAFDRSTLDLALWPKVSAREDMIWVPAVAASEGFKISPFPSIELPGFWMDRYEITNKQFKVFVDAGGYREPSYWRHPFVKQGRALSWDQAVAQFRDATGRPGPAGWQLGSYPDRTESLPVGGVSWYEAAAYAEFAKNSLPTVYEWFRAAGVTGTSDVLRLSNFVSGGPTRVGTMRGMSRFGAYDMAGNVKEWTINATGELRYTLGGAWNEFGYMYGFADAADPFERKATFGFRCIRRVEPVPEKTLGAVEVMRRNAVANGKRDGPVDDRVFRVYAELHADDRTADLDARIVRVDDSSPYWRRETVSLRPAYDDRSRLLVHLFLPKGVARPCQVVTLFGTGQFLLFPTIDTLPDPYQFIVRSGRAVMVPAYIGTLERGPTPLVQSADQFRDHALKYFKDLGRSLDYLETREDIDIGKLAFYGISLGAFHGPRFIALEPRFKVAVFLTGGLPTGWPAEIDPWNYAPRVRIPVLMLNGRDDFLLPLATSQVPLFRALGTPDSQKKHVLYDGGHINLMTRLEVIAEVLDWLDRYLGPVPAAH